MKKCMYPWASLLIENEGIRPCCNTKLNVQHTKGMSIMDVLNSPTFKKFRKSMLDGTTVEDGYCSPNCTYMRSGQASSESDLVKTLPESLLRDTVEVDTVPEMVIFHADCRCNYDCPMCPQIHIHNTYNVRPELTELLYEMDRLATHKFRCLWLGGEPFLPRSKRLLLEVSKKTKNCEFCLLTNGSIFDENLLDNIRLRNITVSIDSIQHDRYQEIRTYGNLDNVLNNLEKFIDYRERKKNFEIGIICVVLNSNYKELPDIIRFFSKYKGIDLTLQEGRVESNKMDIFYNCQTDFLLKKDFLRVLDECDTLKEEISKFNYPDIVYKSIDLMRHHVDNYQIQDHGHVKKTFIL